MKAIKGLEAWGSTYGEGGINKAYEIAEKYFIEGGNNRVVLCTDGDFNVGVSSEAGLKDLISKKKETGVFFSCLGFGSGNYSDTTMKTLASNGNGNYSYIDCPREANKALDEEFFSTIYTVAKDTKFQVEFNPKAVKGYRLIGYETRKMAAEDFTNDKKDGGEVGANQTVTVLYEVVPIDSNFEIPEVVSKYGTETEVENPDKELLTVNIRYKEPDADKSVLKEYPVTMDDFKEEMDEDTSWAAGVAQAGMLMRDSEYSGTSTFNDIYDRLKFDPEIMENDYKAEFLYLLRTMKKYKEQEEKEN
jgi:Ca-activated chloride channel family protein